MRYLLCRPRGGFNDTLSQIFLCMQYAKKTNRKLIIDTTRSGLHDNFSSYFKTVTNDLRNNYKINNYSRLPVGRNC